MSTTTLPSLENRITTVDALRGFALFGILYSHMIFWYTAGPLPQKLYSEGIDAASGIAMGIYGLLFFSKFFSFFSFLFGLSFYIQMKSLMRRNENFILRYGWRLFILGIIGLLHHALWRGDILSIYVPLGFLLIFVRHLNTKIILIIGLVLILNIPTKIYEAVTIALNSAVENPMKNMEKEGQHYYDIVKSAPFMEVVNDNIKALPTKFDYQISSGRLVITFGFFLLGMFAGRKEWFENLDSTKPQIKKIWATTSYILIGTLGVGIVIAMMNFSLDLKLQENKWVMWFGGQLIDILNSGLTIFYIAGLTLLMYKPRWQKILFPLADIGKMALTSYLMQTLFGLLLFYSFGLGLFTETTPAINALLCLGIFAFQILFSKLWLMYFKFGPVEWIWRSLTFLKFQPLINKQPETVPVTIEK